RFEDLRHSRSVWSACALAPLFPRGLDAAATVEEGWTLPPPFVKSKPLDVPAAHVMKQTNTPPSKTRVALTWLMMLGILFLLLAFAFFVSRDRLAVEQPKPDANRPVIMFIVGLFFFVVGIAGYFVFFLTNGLTFDFSQPVWSSL